MLRSEVRWFPTFLRLCREKLIKISQVWTREDNDIIPLLERVLTCRSYRHVVQLLRRHHWIARQVIYELRTRGQKQYICPDVPRNISLQLSQSRPLVSRTLVSKIKEVEASRQVRIRHCGSRARDGKFASPDLSRSLGVE